MATPWYADWVLSRTGIDGQQTDIPADVNRKNNVWQPLAEDRGAYGDFGNISHNKSYTLWAAMNRNVLRAFAAAAVIGLLPVLIIAKNNCQLMMVKKASGSLLK